VIPTLETERLILREWREDDFEPFAAIYADEAQARFIGGVETRDNAWRRMAAIIGHWTLRGYGLWVVAPKETGGFAGWAGCWNPEGFPEPEIGYCVAPSHQRRGYAREAARAALIHAYDRFGWTKAASLIVLDNLPSIRLAESLGARLEREVDFRGARWGVYRHLPPEAVASSNLAH
jgi:RimJ/RimL family protein N-acetyltransferase